MSSCHELLESIDRPLPIAIDPSKPNWPRLPCSCAPVAPPMTTACSLTALAASKSPQRVEGCCRLSVKRPLYRQRSHLAIAASVPPPLHRAAARSRNAGV